MAIIRRTPNSILKNKTKESLLGSKLKEVNRKAKLEVLMIPKYEEISYGEEVMGIVTDCIQADNPDYVSLVVTLYYDVEGRTYKFLYNIRKQSADYLHRFALLFAEYKMTLNLYTIIGKCFIGKVKKNQGYLNLVGIKSITKEELETQLEYMRECANDFNNIDNIEEYNDRQNEGDDYEE